MHLETLAHGHSFLHRLDPRSKLAAAIGLSLAAALGQGLAAESAALGLGIAAVLWARLPWREVGKRLAPVNGFAAMMWLMLPWRLGGTGPLGLGIDPQGLGLATDITLKANAVMLLLLALVATSPVNHVFHALAHWRAPDKLVHLFLFFYRYLHVLHREYHRLNLALKARAFTPRTDLHTYRTYAWLVGMLLVRSYDRAQRVYQAMLCRGFNGTFWLLDHFHWGRRDNLFLAGAGLAFVLLAALGLTGS
jgi:cobalt/nickel transport system permease protein